MKTRQRRLSRLPDLAKHLGVAEKTVLRWLKQGSVPYYGGGGMVYLFDIEEVLAALRRGPTGK